MKRFLLGLGLLSSTFHLPLNAQQVIDGASGPVTVPLNSTGESDGVLFINQTVPNECALKINPSKNVTINSKQNTFGVATQANTLGNLIFASGSYSADIYGKVGDSSSYLDVIFIGTSSNVTFHNRVFCTQVRIPNQTTTTFDADLFPAAPIGITFGDAQSTLSLGGNSLVTGNIGTSTSLGTLIFNDSSSTNTNFGVIGNTTVHNLKVGSSERPYTFSGNLTSQNINFQSKGNHIRVTGDLTLSTNDSNDPSLTVFGGNGIDVDGNFFLPSPKMDLIFKKFDKGTYTIIAASGGTSTPHVHAIPANGLYSGSADCVNGIVTLTVARSQLAKNLFNNTVHLIGGAFTGQPSTGPGSMPPDPMEELLPLSYQFPDSDLAFVEDQITSPSPETYYLNLYQIYPCFGMVGVGRESFNTTKQFQKIWLEHLDRRRLFCGFGTMESPCDYFCDGSQERKVWIDGFGYFGRSSKSQPVFGYKADTWGTTIAAEQPIAHNISAGIGFGYANSRLKKGRFEVDLPHRNTTNIDFYQGSIFGTYLADPWFMDGGISYSYNTYKGTRYFDVNALHRKARSSYSGGEYTGFITSGYQYLWNQFEITPFASMIYSYLHINRFKESGAGMLNSRVRSQNYQYLESGLGLRAAYLLETCYGSFLPEIHAIWQYDFNRTSLNISSSFSELGAAAGYFRCTAPNFDQNYINIGASITCFQNNDFSILLNYDYEKGNHYRDQQGLLQLAYSF